MKTVVGKLADMREDLAKLVAAYNDCLEGEKALNVQKAIVALEEVASDSRRDHAWPPSKDPRTNFLKRTDAEGTP